MNTEAKTAIVPTAREQKERKVYHSPRVEDFGAVNELTRSGSGPYLDQTFGYTSAPPPP